MRRRPLRLDRVAVPDLFEHRQVVVRHRHQIDREAAAVDQFAGGAEVEHGPQTQRGQPGDVVARRPVETVGPIQATPPRQPPVDGLVAAEVTDVEEPFEGNPAVGRLRLDAHRRKHGIDR